MLCDWNMIPDDMQLALTQSALLKASETIAHQAERLADEMETGGLSDRGGPDALRLLAALVRVNDHQAPVAGHA